MITPNEEELEQINQRINAEKDFLNKAFVQDDMPKVMEELVTDKEARNKLRKQIISLAYVSYMAGQEDDLRDIICAHKHITRIIECAKFSYEKTGKALFQRPGNN